MRCERYRDSIQELVDGTLGPIRRAELQQHLDVCAPCRSRLADLQRIRALAESLEHPAPPVGVWLQIAGRLRQEGRVRATIPRASARSRHAILAIAAGLVLAIGASLVALLPFLGPDSEPAAGPGDASQTVQSVQDDFRLAEEHLQRGIARLEEAARGEESVFDAQTAATLKKNLEVIDQAIAESRAALRAEPQSVIARDSLFAALRRKVALLQDTIALMNEMRQGDAAGAARIVGEAQNKS
ncbi:MAG TPA: zf-HC2 domain-containing protein [Vicinamibacterales bacterium]|nr:zf-HC2 domain-containing protein [Vicinamibacterales bacterium]